MASLFCCLRQIVILLRLAVATNSGMYSMISSQMEETVMTVAALDRRSVMKLMAAAGAVTFMVPKAVFAAGRAVLDADGMTVPLVTINRDNSIIIHNPKAEMGQGTSTGVPMLLAEELDADWSNVTVKQLPLRRKRNAKGELEYLFVRQSTGGSNSIRSMWHPMREFGAQGREMLKMAAAKLWNVSSEGLETKNSYVTNPATGERVAYGDLIDEVVGMPVPGQGVTLKKTSEFGLIGRPTKSKTAIDIVTGKPVFGIDQAMPGMLHAVIARSPHFRGAVRSVDAAAALGVPGVVDILTIERPSNSSPLAPHLAAGVAVIAESFWAAKKGRSLLEVEWDEGPFEGYNSLDVEAESLEDLETGDFNPHRAEGNFDTAYRSAATVHDAKYVVPHVGHALMEPHSAIADVRPDRVYMSVPCQHPYRVQDVAHTITGVDQDNIEVDVSRSGGAFGRRWDKDFPAEAAYISKAIGKPVKVSWTREDELTQCRYRNANQYRMTGAVDEGGKLTAMRHRQSSGYPSLDPDTLPEIGWIHEDLMMDHFAPGMVDNTEFAQNFVPSPVPRGPWRAPGSVNSAFAQMSFLDEMARAAGIDPLEFQLSVLGSPKKLDVGSRRYFMETERMAQCFRRAALEAGWGEKLPQGWGRGIAGYYSHLSYVAHVIDVSVRNGDVTVERVTTAADCGLIVNPLGVEAQIEGAIHDGLSVALGQEIIVENAAVKQQNFDTYSMSRIDKSPRVIDIHLIESKEDPTGMGEPAIPPLAPALMNAIHDATGMRVRRLPLANQLST